MKLTAADAFEELGEVSHVALVAVPSSGLTAKQLFTVAISGSYRVVLASAGLNEDSGASGAILSVSQLIPFRFIGGALLSLSFFLEAVFSSLDLFVVLRLIIVEETDGLILTLIFVSLDLLKFIFSVRLEGADSLGHSK